ncbi:MAG: vitamin B12-binding protein [marine bacterium B5-7]|nr:MAG: vitamin B12-binding protein [marine bacterium B5-7]
MRKIIGFLLLSWSTFTVAADAPHRILSLAPNITEILFDIGAGDQVVAVDRNSTYPDEAAKLPKVSVTDDTSAEAILGFKPDLVLMAPTQDNITEEATLEKFNVPVEKIDVQRLKDLSAAYIKLGKLTGHEKEAATKSKQLQDQFDQLIKQAKPKKQLNVFFQLATNPLITVNNKTVIGDVISLCGGENIFGKELLSAPRVSLEAVIKANPDVIVSDQPHTLHTDWQKWPEMTAVKNQHLYAIPPDLIDRPGPRLIDGARLMCRAFRDVAQEKK